MKGQDVMTSNVACHAMLWTENSNEHPKTRDQQKHDIEIPQNRLVQGRSQDFSKGGSQRLLTRLYMVYTAALPRVSAGSVVLSRHEGPY